MPRTTLSRRQALQTLAALPLGFWLTRRLRAAPVPAPKRLVLLMQNNGTQQAAFWPRGPGLSSPILDSLFKDPKSGKDNGLAAKTNIIKGVYVPHDANGNLANEHDMGFARMFTGAPLASRGGQPWGGAISVDQILAQKWATDSLTLAVLASQVEPHPKPGFDHRESFCYLGPATIKHPRRDPLSVYNALFAPIDPHTGHRLHVLDAVAGNLQEVESRLGREEKIKLDYHLAAIADVRSRINFGAGQCPARPAPPTDYLAADPNSELNEDTYIPQMVDNMIDLGAVALVCGATPIVTMQFGYGGGKWRFAWKGINMNCHDDVAHKDTSDAGSTLENTQRVVLMNQYYASCVARLAMQLDAVPESDGSGTMLDNTLIVWANEFGRGDHHQENVPIVLIGKAGGALPVGGRLIDQGRQVFNRLGCTILNVMGMPTAGFGDLPNCGVFQGLL
jgi:hypothetical protein